MAIQHAKIPARPRRTTRTKATSVVRALLATTAAVLCSQAGLADPFVFHSPGNTGNEGRAPFDPENPTLQRADEFYDNTSQMPPAFAPLYLWIDNGTAPVSGTPCEAGAEGVALCAYEVVVRVDNVSGDPVIITDFVPTPPSGYSLKSSLTPSGNATELRVVALNGSTPIDGKHQIGTATLGGGGNCPLGADPTAPCATVSVTGGSIVEASAAMEPIAADPVPLIFVPEPGLPLLLGAGIGGLAWLHRRREARRRRG